LAQETITAEAAGSSPVVPAILGIVHPESVYTTLRFLVFLRAAI